MADLITGDPPMNRNAAATRVAAEAFPAAPNLDSITKRLYRKYGDDRARLEEAAAERRLPREVEQVFIKEEWGARHYMARLKPRK
jgi:hypothetical protein